MSLESDEISSILFFLKITKHRKKSKKGCVFSLDLINLHSQTILRDAEDLTLFIIARQNLNNFRYADDFVDRRLRRKSIYYLTLISANATLERHSR